MKMIELVLLLFSPTSWCAPQFRIKACEERGCCVSDLSINSAVSTFLCFTREEYGAMGKMDKKVKLAEKVVPQLLSENGRHVQVEKLLEMDLDALVRLANLVLHTGVSEARTEDQYISQVTDELVLKTKLSSYFFEQATPHFLSLLNCQMQNKADPERYGRGAILTNLLQNFQFPGTTSAAATTSSSSVTTSSSSVTTSSSSTYYCSISSDHTMCKYTGPSIDCKAKTVKRELTDAEKQAIVDKHNELRRTVAKGLEMRGKPGPQPAASDMVMMVWDDELSTIAQRWADQCTFGQDTKRDTVEGYVGQNAYIGSSTAEMSDTSLAASFTGASTAWYEAVSDPGFSKDSVNPFVYISGTGHYTQLVWGSSRMLGCGSVYYNSGYGSFPYNQLIICNYYSGGNVQGTTMYKEGTACSSCPSDYPTCSDALCTK